MVTPTKHDDVAMLLAWYANGTLSEPERTEVEAHLADCAECTADLTELNVLQSAATEIAAASPEPANRVLTKALLEIDQLEGAETRREEERREKVVGPLKRMAETWRSLWQPVPRFARVAITVQALLLVGLLGVFVIGAREELTYTTASDGIVAPDPSTSRILVGFRDDGSMDEVRALLAGIGGSIVGGPNGLGLYTVQVPIPAAGAGELGELISTLRSDPLIRFVEPVP